jgi:penicillin-binding protein 1C
MTESETSKPEPTDESPENKPRPASQEPPTHPGRRLRRMLEAGEEGDSANIDNTPPYRPSTGQTTQGWYSSLPTNDANKQDSGGKHPTGTPDLKGRGYGEDENAPSTPLFSASDDETRVLPPTPPHGIPVPPKTDETFPPSGSGEVPNRVDEVDRFATRVTPSAYSARTTRQSVQPSQQYSDRTHAQTPISSRPRGTRMAPPSQPPKPPKPAGQGFKGALGCFVRVMVVFAFIIVAALVLVGSVAVIRYFSIASTLPEISDLRAKASQFETTRILDRNGNVLYEILDPQAGRRTYVPLDKISPYLIAATIATEDKDYYNHPGFDPVAISRALWQNYTTGDITSGASTITQQLARALLLSPEERNQKTVERKAREIVLAAEITRRYSKEVILELYLNENYYGNLAYGIEAAAETYFNTTADKLNLGESAFLAGLPQAPAVYDIFVNREETLRRQKQVLVLMYELSKEKNCIEISNNIKPVCVDPSNATEAAREIETYSFQRRQQTIRFPHWVNYIRSVLESQYDSQTIYRSGFTVYTTLDPDLQESAQKIVSDQVASLQDRHATDGALVAIRPATGEILAMVGSADFYNDAISGQVNMAVSPRQPGSSIKPLTYTAAFEKGWTPATLIWDVPSEFPPSGRSDDPAPKYVPVNYDGKFHGPVTVRTALANSFNVPAVKTLNFVGVYNDPSSGKPDGFVSFARRMGITTLTRPDYGLALTLGGGDVSLLELTSAFGVFANSGLRIPPVAITRITDYQGKTVYEYQAPKGEQVVRSEHAYLITSILSDNEARTPMFGANSMLNLPFTVAAKTGTTNDFRDNWTLGYTPDLVVGAWVGNADYTPMVNTTGLTGAAPIWSQFMVQAINRLMGGNPSSFVRPPGIVDHIICADSGAEPSEWCPSQKSEVFAADQPPLSKNDDLWQKVNIDTWTGLRESPYCSDFTKEEFALNIKDPFAIRWIQETDQGRAWAEKIGFNQSAFIMPDRECKADDPRPNIFFAALGENQNILSSPLDIYAVINATKNFKEYRLDYGEGDDPSDWKPLVEGQTSQHSQPEKIYSWDLTNAPRGKVTLRIHMDNTDDKFAERKIHLNIQVPTPTPTVTPTPTLTLTPSLTSTTSPTSTPPEETQTPSPTTTQTP